MPVYTACYLFPVHGERQPAGGGQRVAGAGRPPALDDPCPPHTHCDAQMQPTGPGGRLVDRWRNGRSVRRSCWWTRIRTCARASRTGIAMGAPTTSCWRRMMRARVGCPRCCAAPSSWGTGGAQTLITRRRPILARTTTAKMPGKQSGLFGVHGSSSSSTLRLPAPCPQAPRVVA